MNPIGVRDEEFNLRLARNSMRLMGIAPEGDPCDCCTNTYTPPTPFGCGPCAIKRLGLTIAGLEDSGHARNRPALTPEP